jgi:small-conductance mechanosensitive channel
MDFFSKITDRLVSFIEGVDVEAILLAAAAAIAVTLAIVLLMRLWRKLISRLQARIDDAKSTRLKPLRFQKMDLLSPDDMATILKESLRVLYWLGTGLLVIVNINLVFGFFPATRTWATSLIHIALDASTAAISAFIAYLPKLAVIVITVLLAYSAIKIARLIFRGLATKRITIQNFYPEWAMPTYGLVRLLIIAIAFVLILPNLPAAHSPAFRGVSIFVAVLLSLGSTAAVANIISGIVLTYTRAFKIGDRVRIADTLGDISEKSLFVTRIITPKNVEIAIPNSLVLANHVINYSTLARREPGLVLHTTVTIGYDVPREKVEGLLIEAALATEDLVDDPPPFVLVTSLDDFYVSYEINAYTRGARWMSATYSELHGRIIDLFNAAGVEIMSPHYSAIRDGNPLALPQEHLPKNYQPAPFRIFPFEQLLRKK